jgi:ferredoxin--NADP+ reductase
MHVRGPADPAAATVVRNERCTAGRKPAGFVRHIEFDLSGTDLAGCFRPGQSFGVLPTGLDARGQPHKLRLYSLACPTGGEDGAGNVVSTTVKRLIDEHDQTGALVLGVASNYLCDLKPGDSVRLTGPSGKRFLLPARPDEHDYLFIATGTGIAPFRGMLLDLLRPRSGGPNHASRITLVMGSPYASDLLYDPLLRELGQGHPNFRYLTAISRERQADGGPPMYVQERILEKREELAALLSGPRGLVYVCGLAGMELGVFQSLARLLRPGELEGYLRCDADALGDISAWNRRMIHKQVRPTRRVFLEVY